MSSNRYNAFSKLKIGVGLRAPHILQILSEKPNVDWFEIISENYTIDGGVALQRLDRLLETYSIIQHGVGLNVGSSEGIDREHLKRVKSLQRRTKSPWVSDHLSWGSVGGVHSHDLLPLPYTFEAVDAAVENIRRISGELEVPFVIENVSSYAEWNHSEMTEWQFLSEVAERSDAGILLDVNNIYVSAFNHGFDAKTYLRSLPHERVAQIHLAGHSRFTHHIIDTHDQPVVNGVWELYRETLQLCGPTPTLLEWDANLPSFADMHAEALKATAYWPSSNSEGTVTHAA